MLRITLPKDRQSKGTNFTNRVGYGNREGPWYRVLFGWEIGKHHAYFTSGIACQVVLAFARPSPNPFTEGVTASFAPQR